MGRKVIQTILLICAIFLLLPVKALGAEIQIEQVKAIMPELTMYYYGEKPDSMKAYLDEEELTLTDTYSAKKDKNGVHYYVLVDISASIPDGYFEGMKKGISNLSSEMNAKDLISLISFGDRVNVLYEGKGNTATLHNIIAGLRNYDQNTHFYQAIDTAVTLADEGLQKQRQVVVVFSDGEDCAKGSVTKSETEQTLKEKQIPLYAIAVDCAQDQYIDKFGEFARTTGGTLQLVSPGNTENSLLQIKSYLEKANVAVFKKKNNLASGKKQSFVVSMENPDLNKTIRFVPSKWKKDKKAPEITGAELYKNNQIKVTFSEDVLNADNAGAYSLKYGSKTYVPDKAVYSAKDSYVAILTMPSVVGKGTYQIQTSGITDNSMEKNLMVQVYEGDIDGKNLAARIGLAFLKYWWLWLILLVAIVLGILLFKIYKKKHGAIVTDESIILGPDSQYKHHVQMQNNQGFPIELVIYTGSRETEILPVSVVGSYMVGRSQINDLYFDDTSMSKQHFVLQEEQGMIYIQDLQSSNGTWVNELRINQKRQLNSGDVIQAGAVKMMIRW